MNIFISSYPPLGQVSVVEKVTTFFTVAIEVKPDHISNLCQASLWHSDGEDQNWLEECMSPWPNSSDPPIVLHASKKQQIYGQIFFTAMLDIKLIKRFTIKFRNSPDQPWNWSRDLSGISDGIIILKHISLEKDTSDDLRYYIPGLSPLLQSNKSAGKYIGMVLWSIEASIEAARKDKSRWKTINFGMPWGKMGFLSWMAIVRHQTPWLAPRQGKTEFKLDKGAIMCSFLNHQGKHMVLLSISFINHVSTFFESNDEGNVVLQIRNDDVNSATSRILVGVGDDFESVTSALIDYAREYLILQGSSKREEEKLDFEYRHNKNKTPFSTDWYDGFTYCTWNGLGRDLTEEKILAAVTSLAENHINVSNFIIDDGWQALDHRGPCEFQHGWVEFEADRQRFPRGLKHTIDQIRQKHQCIENVAVWHAILGYWGGIAPNGKLAKAYNTIEVLREDDDKRNLPVDGKMTVVRKEDVARFYDDFYRFLSSCGVGIIKTDVQSMLDTFVSAESRRDLITTYLDVWTATTSRYFASRAISCMSQIPQCLFYSQLSQRTPRFVVRNSDDYYPEIPASHPWHIFSNAHNSLITQYLNSIPDWDMFQTVHEYSGYHAAARCISGGPVYITDVPGRHDLDLINKITGCTFRGKTILIRPRRAGRSLNQYIGFNDNKLLLIGTHHEEIGIIGIFNVSQCRLVELIPLSKFPLTKPEVKYVVRAQSTGLISKPSTIAENHALISISASFHGYEILSSFPLTSLTDGKGSEILVSNLGLLDKMIGSAAIVTNQIVQLKDRTILVETKLKALGILGIYFSATHTISIQDHLCAMISERTISHHFIEISKDSVYVIEFDIAAAWEELGLQSEGSDKLKIIFNLI